MSRWNPDDDLFDLDEPAPASPRRMRARLQTSAVARHPARFPTKLAAAIAAILLAAIAVTLLVGGTSRASADRSFLRALQIPAAASERVGSSFATLLKKTTLTAPNTAAAVDRLAARQAELVTETQDLRPPAWLESQASWALNVMRIRSDALRGIARVLRTTLPQQTVVEIAARLVAADVLWRDFFLTPVRAQLRRDNEHDTLPPPSTCLTDERLDDPSALAAAVTRLRTRRASIGGSVTLKSGDHGTAVAAWQRLLNRWLRSQPSLKPLTVDGNYGGATAAATAAFQAASRLVADGVAGPVTQAALAKTVG